VAAATALAASASTSLSVGDTEAAAAALERALRIEPENPALWHQLAQVRLAAGEPGRAERLAIRSNQLAGEQPRLVRANWQLIAEARRLRGDQAGAAAARDRARR
jgi:predicted Zn-dependent protease